MEYQKKVFPTFNNVFHSYILDVRVAKICKKWYFTMAFWRKYQLIWLSKSCLGISILNIFQILVSKRYEKIVKFWKEFFWYSINQPCVSSKGQVKFCPLFSVQVSNFQKVNFLPSYQQIFQTFDKMMNKRDFQKIDNL